MLRWSTTGAEQLIRKVMAPVMGMALLGFEGFLHDGPARWPVISAGVALALGQPLAKLFDGDREAPAAPGPPVPPPSPTGPTGGPL